MLGGRIIVVRGPGLGPRHAAVFGLADPDTVVVAARVAALQPMGGQPPTTDRDHRREIGPVHEEIVAGCDNPCRAPAAALESGHAQLVALAVHTLEPTQDQAVVIGCEPRLAASWPAGEGSSITASASARSAG